MTKRSYLIATTILLFSTSALAAPVFMLQFGSFETKEEAEKHLGELTTKHAASVSALSPTIREVTLPPDNLTVYRTQAGPVASKPEAQAICSKLAVNGGQCYIVETAMIASASAPKAPVAPAIVAPLVSAAAPVVAAAEEAVASPNTLAVAGLVENGSPGFAELPTLESTIPAAPPAPLVDTRAIDTALDDAAARQAAAATAVAAAPAAVADVAKKEERSFWSRLNPFGSDTPETPAPKAPVIPPSDTALAAPVDKIMTETTVPPTPFVVDPSVQPPLRPIAQEQPPLPVIEPITPLPSPELLAAAPAPALSAPLSPPAAIATTAAPEIPNTPPPMPAPVAVEPVPAPAAGTAFILPPPPAPLRAQDRDALASGTTPPSAPPIAAPQPTGSLHPVAETPTPFVAAPVPAIPFAPASAGKAPAAVIAPPVSAVAAPVVSQPVPLPNTTPLPPQPAVSLGQKTLWAQISQFNDEQEALAFWDAYTQAHPDFPAVRVRVTAPLQGRGAAVSLRVGPFARVESIRNLCSTMPVKKLRCGSVTDLGVSADPRAAHTGVVPDSRYNR